MQENVPFPYLREKITPFRQLRHRLRRAVAVLEQAVKALQLTHL